LLQTLQQLAVAPLPVFEHRDLLFQAARLRRRAAAGLILAPVRLGQFAKIALDPFVDLLQQGFQLLLVEVAILGVLRGKFAPVDGHQFAAEELQLSTKQGKLPAHRLDRRPVVLAEIRDRLEVGRQLAQQPEDFQVASRFGFQPPAAPHPVEVAVKVEPQQVAGVIRRTARLRQRRMTEAERLQRQPLDERVDETHRVFRRDVVVDDFRKEQALLTTGSSNVVHAGI
jgi:hypothetical protein